MSKVNQMLGKWQFCIFLLVFIIPFCGCGDGYLKRKYRYTPPEVPSDIPQFVATNARIRGLEPSEPGQQRIDLHKRYLTAHERGFCDAAREWEAERQLKYKTFQDAYEWDASVVEMRGYWDGYSLFRRLFRTAEQGQNEAISRKREEKKNAKDSGEKRRSGR